MSSQFVLRCGYHLLFVRKDMYLMDVKLFFLHGIKGSIPSSILSFFLINSKITIFKLLLFKQSNNDDTGIH